MFALRLAEIDHQSRQLFWVEWDQSFDCCWLLLFNLISDHRLFYYYPQASSRSDYLTALLILYFGIEWVISGPVPFYQNYQSQTLPTWIFTLYTLNHKPFTTIQLKLPLNSITHPYILSFILRNGHFSRYFLAFTRPNGSRTGLLFTNYSLEKKQTKIYKPNLKFRVRELWSEPLTESVERVAGIAILTYRNKHEIIKE